MPRVYEQDRGDIQADMYAYNMAAADQGVKHATYGTALNMYCTQYVLHLI
jgi:hypothetical protein